MRALFAIASLCAFALSAAACGATVEVPRVCFTQSGLTVAGAPAGGDVQTPPVSFRVNLTDQIPLLRTNTSDADLRIQDVTITPVGTSPDLSGIQTATARVQPPAGAAVDVVRYQRSASATAPTSLVLAGDTVNIAPYLDNGQASLSFTLSGQPPKTNWTADVTSCLHGETHVSP